MQHYVKECPNLQALLKENVSSSIQRFSGKEESKAQVHLIEPMSER